MAPNADDKKRSPNVKAPATSFMSKSENSFAYANTAPAKKETIAAIKSYNLLSFDCLQVFKFFHDLKKNKKNKSCLHKLSSIKFNAPTYHFGKVIERNI